MIEEGVEERKARQAARFREALALDEAAAGKHPLTGLERETLRGTADCRAANAILWELVGEHERSIRWQARRYARRVLSAGGFDAIVSILRLGWFRGALRFDPDEGILFNSYGQQWGLSALQRSNDRHTSVAVDSRAFRERGPWSWQPVEGEVALGDAGSMDSPEERVEAAETIQRVHRAISLLPPNDRILLRDRFLRDRAIADTAAARGVSRQHVNVLTQRALGRMRALLDDPTRTR